MLRALATITVVICLAAPAGSAPITPSNEEEAARQALGDRLPNAGLLWVNLGKIYFTPIRNFNPQQVTLPSAFSPQVCNQPALTRHRPKSPVEWAGGVDWPSLFHPQQATLPSVFSPQVCNPPALTWAKSPEEWAGGVDCPVPLFPQQATLPSVLSPQV